MSQILTQDFLDAEQGVTFSYAVSGIIFSVCPVVHIGKVQVGPYVLDISYQVLILPLTRNTCC